MQIESIYYYVNSIIHYPLKQKLKSHKLTWNNNVLLFYGVEFEEWD